VTIDFDFCSTAKKYFTSNKWPLNSILEDKRMDTKIPIEELLYEEEGTTLDFKREQYPFTSANDHQKSEILKDILAFSNAWRRSDAYILIGVEELKGGRSKPLGIQDELDDAQLQQFVNSKTQRPINFTYKTILVDSLKIGVICIPVQSRPYYLERDYGKLRKHVVYVRRGSSTAEASPDEVHKMGHAEATMVQEIPKLKFEFADIDKRTNLGTEKHMLTTILDIPELKKLPDYREEQALGRFAIPSLNPYHVNSNYYRDIVNYYYMLKRSQKLSFSLINSSQITISNITVELCITCEDNKFDLFVEDNFPAFPQSRHNPVPLRPLLEQIAKNSKPSVKIQNLGDRYRIEIPFEKTQPQQTVFCNESIYIAANERFERHVKVIIYADNIPVPIETSLAILCEVENAPGGLEDIKVMHAEILMQNRARAKLTQN
jgi:Putative DNA-binding domain